MKTENKKHCSSAELAEIVGLGITHINAMCRTGKIANAFKIGRFWHIPIQDAEELINKQIEKREKKNEDRKRYGLINCVKHTCECCNEEQAGAHYRGKYMCRECLMNADEPLEDTVESYVHMPSALGSYMIEESALDKHGEDDISYKEFYSMVEEAYWKIFGKSKDFNKGSY